MSSEAAVPHLPHTSHGSLLFVLTGYHCADWLSLRNTSKV
jgi:hypothetical protein